jgi:(R)-2-hydroxyacyl-CoA dehydratese activating ATPase
MTVTAGIDIGSTYAKVVVLKDGVVAGYGVNPTGAFPDESAKKGLKDALAQAGLKEEEIQYSVSTGYGRRIASFANENISEISANARGSKHVGQRFGIRTIIDIGGQDTKVISLDDNCDIINFQMNDKCAAGTGRFLEVLAHVLGIGLDQMGPLSLNSKRPVEITTTCLVFAKSEISTYLAQGIEKEDLISGIHTAIARRLLVMAKKVGVRREVFFDGGPARNIGMVSTFERELGHKIIVPEVPQIVTATGAAVLAAEKLGWKPTQGIGK